MIAYRNKQHTELKKRI